jgi:hypothetical protein
MFRNIQKFFKFDDFVLSVLNLHTM